MFETPTMVGDEPAEHRRDVHVAKARRDHHARVRAELEDTAARVGRVIRDGGLRDDTRIERDGGRRDGRGIIVRRRRGLFRDREALLRCRWHGRLVVCERRRCEREGRGEERFHTHAA